MHNVTICNDFFGTNVMRSLFTARCPKAPRGRRAEPSRRRAMEKKSIVGSASMESTTGEGDEDARGRRKNPSLYEEFGGDERKVTHHRVSAPSSRKRRKKPDVLAPAGGWAQLEAAVKNGADCVYFGLEVLNARARANNFTVEELPRVMTYVRERGVKGYVTMNVLIFDDELRECERLIRACAKNGVDAMIVQDVGAARLVKRVAPNMVVHGSTQMSITDANGALFAKEIGCERVVVGRELSISEIKTVVDKSPETTVEAFTHGALCVSYSGQCFSSEAWGGRSANRGQCAQACRMPYGFVVNGKIKAMGDEKYLLSPQDLMAVDLVPELIDAGISCFKIEGRLKGEEYVGLTTAAYRRAVDLAWENRNVSKKELLTDESRLELRQVFARAQDEQFDGLTTGFLEGTRHQTIVRGRNPRHRGVFAGRVVEVDTKNEQVTIQTRNKNDKNDDEQNTSSMNGILKRGFGVVFDDGTPELDEQGGFIYEIFDERGSYVDSSELCSSEFVTLAFARNSLDYKKIRPGNIVWRTSTTSEEKKAQHRKKEKSEEAAVTTSSSVKTSAATASMGTDGRDDVVCIVSGALHEPLKIALYDTLGNVGEALTSVHISEAKKQPIDFQSIAKALGELGGTPFFLDAEKNMDCKNLFSGAKDTKIFVPAGEIKKARRDAVEILLEKRRNMGVMRAEEMASDDVSVSDVMYKSEIEKWWGVPIENTASSKRGETTSSQLSDEPKLTLLCRTMEQVETCCAFDFLDEIQADFLEVHGLRDAVKKIQETGKKAVVATPRVLKPDEEKLWRFYLSLNADALLVRSAGLLRKLHELISEHAEEGKNYPRLRGDFSLNAANVLTTSTFLETFNLERLALTHDLNARQIRNLASALPETASSKIEIILHCHLPIFHTEHCVFCRFLSDGNSYKDCGHPCETNDARLRDSNGKDHLVLADMGCRNTVFNAEAQSGAMFVQDWINIGNIRNYRIELVDTNKNETIVLLETYDKLLNGEISSRDAYDALRKVKDKNGNVQGCNIGSFAVREEKSRDGMKKTAAEIKMKKAKKAKKKKPSVSM